MRLLLGFTEKNVTILKNVFTIHVKNSLKHAHNLTQKSHLNSSISKIYFKIWKLCMLLIIIHNNVMMNQATCSRLENFLGKL